MPISPTEPDPRDRKVFVAPGEAVAIHWLALDEGLTEAQAAAAARLLLADAAAEPLAGMHVAVGHAEQGLIPVALVASARMAEWLESDPDVVIPAPFLLAPPEEGLVRRDGALVSDYRGLAAAFSAEPALAARIVGDAPVRALDEAEYAAGMAAMAQAPPLDLRQGPYARRRQWALDRKAGRRIALFALLLALLSLVLQLATIARYTFAADRLETEAAALGAAPGAARRVQGFSATAAALFAAVRATPNVELVRIDYRADGSLAALVGADSPATLDLLRRQLESGGMRTEPGAPQGGSGRPTAELVMRPA